MVCRFLLLSPSLYFTSIIFLPQFETTSQRDSIHDTAQRNMFLPRSGQDIARHSNILHLGKKAVLCRAIQCWNSVSTYCALYSICLDIFYFFFISLAYHLSFWPTTGKLLGKLDCVGRKRVLWGERGGLDEAASDSSTQSCWHKTPVWQTAGPPGQLVHYSVDVWGRKTRRDRKVLSVYSTHILLHEVLMTGRKKAIIGYCIAAETPSRQDDAVP